MIVVFFLFQADGGIEYFNTIVVQPHLKLVTNQGRGFHVKCRYQTRDKIISNDQTQVGALQSLPLRVSPEISINFSSAPHNARYCALLKNMKKIESPEHYAHK